ncbi:glycosyltransferase [Cellulosimicrobium cellulans]|uniref:glycosyltransferase n=1 Tax=Cellulosimicrobium cellulans TaxID=1710 RepID=UPI0002DF70E8|nr:glycosyltransferase [Cellulosimicrobium cellulans]
MRTRKTIVAAGLALAALAMSYILVPVEYGRHRPLVAGAVLSILATAGICFAIAGRSARRVITRLSRLEKIIVDNHKRASVWNYHLVTGLGLRETTTDRPAKSQAARTENTTNPQVARNNARALIRAGIFDSEYYSACLTAEFNTAFEAAEHYLLVGAATGLRPTPFLDPTALPENVEAALRSGHTEPLLAYLRSLPALESPLSAIFDPRMTKITMRVAERHPGGVLGAYLADLNEDSRLAVPADRANAGARVRDMRNALIQYASSLRHAQKRYQPRTQSTWDEARETAFLEEISGVSVPTPGRVSVVMAVRDRADRVDRAIESVRAQSHDDWELIIVDDCSRDETRKHVESWTRMEARVRLVQGTGAGAADARNRGLALASGDYIAFLDSDNAWTPKFLETMLKAMRRDDLGAAHSAAALESSSGTEYLAFDGGLEELLDLNHVDLNTLVLRDDVRRIVGDFDVSLKRWIDHDFAIRVASVADLPLVPFVGCVCDRSESEADRISVRESEHWQWVVLGKHHTSWNRHQSQVPGRLSVVIPTHNDLEMTRVCVSTLIASAEADGIDVEVIVVDNGSRPEIGVKLDEYLVGGAKVQVVHLDRNFNFAIGSNIGASHASGEFLLFLNNDTEVRGSALRRLLDELASSPSVIGVQPLLLFGNERIQSAGTVFNAHDALPGHLLVGHPAADAANLRSVDLQAVSAAALLMRASDFQDLQGFDPIFVNGMEDVDLCLRARLRTGRHFRVVPDALVTHLEGQTPGRGANLLENRRLFLQRWHGSLPVPEKHLYAVAGFSLAHIGTDGLEIPGPKPIIVRDPSDQRLRWGIKIASFSGGAGDAWGDTHFAESLRAALERSGQAAVVHRATSHASAATAFDDVALVIRGKTRVPPQPGKINILWVISHPDEVTPVEVCEYDLVFAASEQWSRRLAQETGRAIGTLLQATDPSRFNTEVQAVQMDGTLFVGGRHEGRERPSVALAWNAGVPLTVYGKGWRGVLPHSIVGGEYIPNERLAAYYRGASRVLADHWDDMAAEGFIQNRVFDAVASGTRVVSDPVEGLDSLFGGAVRTYASAEDLVRLCTSDADFATPAEMAMIAERVRRDHSFDRRATKLVDAALKLQAARAHLKPRGN